MSRGPSHVFQVAADGFTLADVTAGWVSNHVIQIHGEKGVSNTRSVLWRLHLAAADQRNVERQAAARGNGFPHKLGHDQTSQVLST